jgi:hypothetical protein
VYESVSAAISRLAFQLGDAALKRKLQIGERQIRFFGHGPFLGTNHVQQVILSEWVRSNVWLGCGQDLNYDLQVMR